MAVVRVVTFYLLLFEVYGVNYSELDGLIKRIQNESEFSTMVYICVDGDFFSEPGFQNLDVPAVVFTSSASIDFGTERYTNAILISQSSCAKHHLQALLPQFAVRRFVVVLGNRLDDLYGYFLFFYENKFTRIFGIVDDVQYAFLPYADQQIQSISKEGLLPHAMKDLNGYTIKTLIAQDIPTTFWYPDKKGQLQIGGWAGQAFVNFIRRHNASFTEIPIDAKRSWAKQMADSAFNGEMDIAMNMYPPKPPRDYSYPVKTTMYKFVVPLNKHVKPMQHFMQPFSFMTWISVILTLLYIAILDVVKDIFTRRRPDVWHSLSRTFLLFLSLPPLRPVTTAYRFHTQTFLFTFILMNFYMSHFTSFVTVFIPKQYNTIQDLIDNNVPVMMETYTFRHMQGEHPAGLEKIVTLVNLKTAEENFMRNTNFAYLGPSDKINFILRLHSFFEEPLYQETRDGLTSYPIAYTLATQSPFKDILNRFIFEISETGLFEKWESDAIWQAMKVDNSLARDRKDYLRIRPIGFAFKQLRFAVLFWILCLIVSMAVFLCEKFGGVFLRHLNDNISYGYIP